MVNRAAGTAVGPMVIAAVEHHYPAGQRLVDDAAAASVLPATSRWVARAAARPRVRDLLIRLSDKAAPGVWGSIACRKRYIDEQLVEAAADGIRTVVVLGSGLDTRGHRLAVPAGARVFEVDLPVNVEAKRRRVGVPDGITPVPVDFESHDWGEALLDHGYRPDERCLVVWEGVTQYLSEAAVRRTFDVLAGVTPGSRLVFTYVLRDFLDGVDLCGAEALHRRFVAGTPLWRFGLHPSEVAGFLARYGWHEVEQAGHEELAARYVRPTGRTVSVTPLERTVVACKR
ncbi:methyltransferase (TIGR00027 family) [Saccharothrix carnea]|uniref:S-adenosyl-L-methionine-dependent methyltransferase n=1 Tax=Saccharothrix carnea TaxID=1280637 RepID=A0A2P8I432_SACCR|nr:methyltransferase (TIGR00027 family) [Saccharothrix carnea]